MLLQRLVHFLILLLSIWSHDVDKDKDSKNKKTFIKCFYSSNEFDIFYNNELTQSVTSIGPSGVRSSFLTAPLRDFYNASKVVGLWTVREFNSLRDTYNIQDYVTTLHFFDKNHAGGSSLIMMSTFFSTGNGNFLKSNL